MFRRVLVFLVLALTLAVTACGGSGGGTKTFDRTVLPAADAPNAAKDPKLTEDRLRIVHPCRVLAKLKLDKYGATDQTSMSIPQDPSYCDADIPGKNSIGTSNFIELQLMAPADPSAMKLDAERVRGLPTHQEGLNHGDSCELTVLTDSRAKKGLKARMVRDGDETNCAAARDIAGKAIDLLRTNPPGRNESNSIGMLKPCDLVDGGTSSAVLGSSSEGRPETGAPYTCQWQGAGAGLVVELRVGKPKQDPKAKKVDLGNGVQALQTTGRIGFTGLNGCTMSWQFRTDKYDFHENVNVSATEDQQGKGGDLCFKAFQTAKVVVTKLPKA